MGTEGRIEETILSELPAEDRESVQEILEGRDSLPLPKALEEEHDEATEEEALEEKVRRGDIYNALKIMTVPQKIKLALFGNRIARLLLLRENSRQIHYFVLKNPRLTDNDVIEISRTTSLDETILRMIASNSTWMKLYPVKLGLVSNPKTPIDVSLKWIRYLQEKDLRRLAKSKSIPHVIASQCRKVLEKG